MLSRPVLDTLETENIASFKADITVESSEDKEFLRSLKLGTEIPLLVVFAPGAEEPYVLRGLYSRNDLLGLIEQAKADAELGLEAEEQTASTAP